MLWYPRAPSQSMALRGVTTMRTWILLILLCVGILSAVTGCYVAPYPYGYYAPRPYVSVYPHRHYGYYY